MELTPDILQELTDSTAAAPPPAGADGRAVPRLKSTREVTILRLDDKSARPLTATLRDLSLRGAGLITPEPIHTGCPFAMRLSRRDGSILWLHCVSVRWSPIDAATCSVGAKFTGMSGNTQAVAL